MPHAKVVAALALAVVLLCGCSAVVKPPQGHGRVEDPRTSAPNRLACLRTHHLPAREVGRNGLQIGPLPAGPTVQFVSTPGAAIARQVEGQAEGAEIIGTALLYPHQASDAELSRVENCLALDVTP